MNDICKQGRSKKILKSIKYIEDGHPPVVDLKVLQPKRERIWQFRIFKKYRTLATKVDNNLCVFEISDHQ